MIDRSFNISKVNRIDNMELDMIRTLLHRIISFLPYKDAVRNSMLSKTWEKACCTFSVLEFDEDLFEPDLQEMRSARCDVKKCNQIKGKLLNY